MQERTTDQGARHIARYDILGELGHGGMAVVYRGRDPRLEREVAIKVLHPHLARDPESRARFEREARAAARLRHPNIVEVYEFDASEADSYLVTELLEGPTLRAHFESVREMPAEVVAAIGAVLCDALGCAHAQGVIHRDVKPDNVMLHHGLLKLTDFGIAHIVDAREMTATGQVLGSPAHMAPEQIEGTAVDARTDLFALGTVLYFLATGKLPFDAPTAHSLLKRILDGDYTDPVRVNPRVGDRFGGILRRALSRHAKDRYQTAAEFKTALLDFMREADWELPDKVLLRYFADPKGVCDALRETLVAKLPGLGVEARRRGDVPAAMGYFNRALALDPGNPKIVALVRSAARRRQWVRGLRAAAITLGVALGTAAAVLAFFPKERLARPVVVMPQEAYLPPRRDDPTIARANVSPRSVPELSPDAGASGVPGATDAATVAAHTRPQPPPQPPQPHTGGSPPATVVAARRTVIFIPQQRTVMFSVDGGQSRPWDSGHAELDLTVGPHTFVLEPIGSTHFERTEWVQQIDAGTEPLRLRPSLRERAVLPGTSLVLARDGGSVAL